MKPINRKSSVILSDVLLRWLALLELAVEDCFSFHFKQWITYYLIISYYIYLFQFVSSSPHQTIKQICNENLNVISCHFNLLMPLIITNVLINFQPDLFNSNFKWLIYLKISFYIYLFRFVSSGLPSSDPKFKLSDSHQGGAGAHLLSN